MIWIWILVIIITFWGIKIVWNYTQSGNNSSANSGTGLLIITKVDNLNVTLDWGNGPITNGNFTILTKKTFGFFSNWQVAQIIPGNGYTGGMNTITLGSYGLWQFKVTGDMGYVFGIKQKYI